MTNVVELPRAGVKHGWLRGMGTHALLQDVFEGHDWQVFSKMKRDQFVDELTRVGHNSNSDNVHTYFNNEAALQKWIAGCYKHLFKTLLKWETEKVMVEPDLGVYQLPNRKYELRLGQPDLAFYSPLLSGVSALEIKTGWKVRSVKHAKIMRYLLGMRRYLKDRDLPELRSIVWVSFSCMRPGGQVWPEPVMKKRVIPYNEEVLARWLLTTYGLTLAEFDELPVLPTPDYPAQMVI